MEYDTGDGDGFKGPWARSLPRSQALVQQMESEGEGPICNVIMRRV